MIITLNLKLKLGWLLSVEIGRDTNKFKVAITQLDLWRSDLVALKVSHDLWVIIKQRVVTLIFPMGQQRHGHVPLLDQPLRFRFRIRSGRTFQRHFVPDHHRGWSWVTQVTQGQVWIFNFNFRFSRTPFNVNRTCPRTLSDKFSILFDQASKFNLKSSINPQTYQDELASEGVGSLRWGLWARLWGYNYEKPQSHLLDHFTPRSTLEHSFRTFVTFHFVYLHKTLKNKSDKPIII